jgi:hypothetical protein
MEQGPKSSLKDDWLGVQARCSTRDERIENSLPKIELVMIFTSSLATLAVIGTKTSAA